MNNSLFFERRVEPRLDKTDVKIEKLGVGKYRMHTCSDGEFDFRNRMVQEAFERNFVQALNRATPESQDLDIKDHDVQLALRELERSLEHGQNSAKLKITFRMQHGS